MSAKLWEPSQSRIDKTLLRAFMVRAEREYGLTLPSYDAVWEWSVKAPAEFWSLVWKFCDVQAEGSVGTALNFDGALLDAKFFPQERLNFAQNMLRRRGPEVAIIFHAENGKRRELSWDDLHDQVARTSRALTTMGVQAGDRVVGYMPNMPEAVIAMLATAAIGGIWSSCSPDFGTQGMLDRFGQIEPKVLFTANGYDYNGKSFDSLPVVAELSTLIPSLAHVVVVPLTKTDPDLSALDGKGVGYQEMLQAHSGDDIDYVAVGFNDPAFILYSSGTTGVPKCIVHRAGGVLLQHLKEHQLQCDVQPGDRLFYFTTCGWMMWNWLVSGLASGATIVLFDGSPFFPDGNRLASIVEEERVTHFGTSAKYLDACAKAGVRPADSHDLSNLRTILSTGSPLSPDGFDYVYGSWKADVCLASIAGGTDIVGCFVGGDPIGPVFRGECQKRHLGMDVQAFDEQGRTLLNQPGELVCRTPHPSMPWGFWNDPGQERYRAAYFEVYDNVWHHGDLIEVKDTGGVVFFGRSDATLNPGGVRIGTAEIYRQVDRVPEVLDAVVVGQNWDDDVRVVLFVKLQDGAVLDEALIKRIKTEIRTNTTPRHVPAKVLSVTDIPRTKSGKTAELAVRDVIHGREVRNQHALANPESLGCFENLPELAIAP